MNKNLFDLPVRVLVYDEDGETVAHGLEMDLLGFGATAEEAVDELIENIKRQISFAAAKGQPEMVYFPAGQALFDRWEKAHTDQLKGLLARDQSAKLDVNAVIVSIPQAEESGGMNPPSRFEKERDPACA